ncbi:MAG: putative DNA-binding domain-containing protein [Cellvibrionaceae bacterium]
MSDAQFLQSQSEFIAHLRDPEKNPAPADVEDRRMAIYRDLIYNNIEGFLSGNFPIVRQIFSDEDWREVVRDFIRSHQSHTPYFLEIGQEFLAYLQNDRPFNTTDPKFLLELAHYEWVELALDISTEVLPKEINPKADLLKTHPVVSPLAWNLSYQYPVHKIGPEYQPESSPAEPTFLVVYRNRNDEVKFMESNSATSHLLTILTAGGSSSSPSLYETIDDGSATKPTGEEALKLLAKEMNAPNHATIIHFGQNLLTRLQSLGIICGGI